MNTETNKSITHLENILFKILEKLEDRERPSPSKYYRNKDLKSLFGLSPNTIIKYREEGNLPFTLLGEIYLYPINEVDKKLKKNANY